MKKILSATLLSLLAVLVFPVAASAATPAQTMVSGVVKQSGKALAGANVSVTCNGTSGSDTSDTDGSYLVGFSAEDCPSGATVTAVASKGDAAGSKTGKANQIGGTKLNVAVVDVDVALPEMSTIVSGIAAVGAGGAFLIIRRKQSLGLN